MSEQKNDLIIKMKNHNEENNKVLIFVARSSFSMRGKIRLFVEYYFK